ncbi:histidinol-phosphate aminotransferase [Helicobacter sp. CLO-3]|nr:histidinol-phosphate aminotransferase [Helicobacter sp. CLO-3]OHU84049.1 histidinol-phosphate aminotransferase [Helicobacter sp. CLO-3]
MRKNPNVLFLVDEAYYEFYGKSVCHLITECKNLIITRTFSKAFALACFRIGYCISNEENIKAINKLRNPKSVAMPSQIAASAALDDIEYMHSFVKEVKAARDFFINGLQKLNIQISTQSEANFVLFQSRHAKELAFYMQSNGIFVRDYAHIIPNACRITIGTQEQMHKVLECIKQFLDK